MARPRRRSPHLSKYAVDSPLPEPHLVEAMTDLVARAGTLILAVSRGDLGTRLKPDRSPVTAADEASEAVIMDGLRTLLPAVPVVSEEDAESRAAPPDSLRSAFILVDPLDGTREFVEGRHEYTVNVALIAQGVPVFGVVGAPALGLIWRGVGDRAERLRLDANGSIAETTRIRARRWPARGRIALVSRSHLDARTEAFIDACPRTVAETYGSSLKFCRLAEGVADIYPRLAPTSEWDIAAGHAVLAAAGGTLLTPDGGPLTYGRDRGFRVASFLAFGDAQAAPGILASMKPRAGG